jgi:MOSC domain-containing protein YiiM
MVEFVMEILALFICQAHTYFGHHGKPAGEEAMTPMNLIECVAGRGVKGDRFFDYKPDYKGQITFFASEIHADVTARLGVEDRSWAGYRRNVITRGVDLNSLIGKEFEIQGVRFFGTEECRPCYWMDQAIAPGAEEALKGNGGLRARILCDGLLRVDVNFSVES